MTTGAKHDTPASAICVVHLRRPIGNDGVEKQQNQCRALLRWAMRHLSGNPKANVVILDDFSEGHPVGSDGQALAVLFQAKPPMVDALSTLSGNISTHTDGKVYDRILVSDAIAKGLNRLRLERVVIQPHRHGKGEERRFYTDHYPVVALFKSHPTDSTHPAIAGPSLAISNAPSGGAYFPGSPASSSSNP